MATVWFIDKEEALRIVRIDRELIANSSVYERNPRLLLTVSALEVVTIILHSLCVALDISQHIDSRFPSYFP